MRTFALAGLLAAGAGLAPAQTAEASLGFGQSIFRENALGTLTSGVPNPNDFFKVNEGFRVNGRFTLNPRRFLGHEFGYGYTRSKIEYPGSAGGGADSMPTHQGYYNVLLYATPEGSAIRPFVAGGGHFSTYYPPGTSAYYGNGETKFGVNYGAGVKVKVSPVFYIRFDLRDYSNPKPFSLPNSSGWLHQIEASGGFGIHF